MGDIQDTETRRFYILAKLNNLAHFQAAEYKTLIAADVSGNNGVAALLETCLADKFALAERTQQWLCEVLFVFGQLFHGLQRCTTLPSSLPAQPAQHAQLIDLPRVAFGGSIRILALLAAHRTRGTIGALEAEWPCRTPGHVLGCRDAACKVLTG